MPSEDVPWAERATERPASAMWFFRHTFTHSHSRLFTHLRRWCVRQDYPNCLVCLCLHVFSNDLVK